MLRALNYFLLLVINHTYHYNIRCIKINEYSPYRMKKKKKKRQIKEDTEEDIYSRELSQMLEDRSKRPKKKKEERSSNRRTPTVENVDEENRSRKRHLVRDAVIDVTEI